MTVDTKSDDSEQAQAIPVSTTELAGITFQGGVSLKAVQAVSLPPLEPIFLYGGVAIDPWLESLGLSRWRYEDFHGPARAEYEAFFYERCPLTASLPPFARLGGWHLMWSDDDDYIPHEMRLMIWSFEESEPWDGVFLSGRSNHVIRERIT